MGSLLEDTPTASTTQAPPATTAQAPAPQPADQPIETAEVPPPPATQPNQAQPSDATAAAPTSLTVPAETAPAVDGEQIVSADAASLGAPFDVVILGMGTDGHTASFFPGGSNLAEAISAATPRGVMTMEAEGAGETRLTFTFASLQDARFLVLHIEGQGKKDVLAAAESDGPEADMPVRAILRRAATPVDIYWAP